MQHYSRANSRWRNGLLAFVIPLALGAGIAACDRAPPRPPEVPMATVAPAAPRPIRDRSQTRGDGKRERSTNEIDDQGRGVDFNASAGSSERPFDARKGFQEIKRSAKSSRRRG
jgi:hypothetical protein